MNERSPFQTELPGAIFTALEGGVDRVVDVAHPSLRVLGRNFQGFPAVELRLPVDERPETPEDSYGLQFLWGSSDTSSTLVIVGRSPYQAQAFLELVDKALARTGSLSSAGEAGRAFIKTISDYRALFEEGGAGRVQLSELRGFIGELLALFHLHESRGCTLEAALRAWQGPWGASRDFVFSEGSMCEVKTVHLDGRHVTISSMDQLTVMERALELVVVELEQTAAEEDGSFVLSSLVRRIERELSGSSESLPRLHQALRLAGIDYRQYEDLWFRPGKTMSWAVDDDFPSLTRRNVPPEISEVTYKIDLSRLSRPTCTTSQDVSWMTI